MKPIDLFSTYSIVARDPETGRLGVAVQTHQMGVGSVVPWLIPGVGAVATQSLVNVSFGPLGLAMLQAGVPAPKVVEALVASDGNAARRQLAVVDANGRAAAWTGQGCIPEAQHHIGEGYSVQANMMTLDSVVPAMARAFEAATGDLAQRMMQALEAAQAEDGDIRGMQSAALKVVSGDTSDHAWETLYDLRVDESADPLTELARLVRLRHAQLVDQSGYEALRQGNHGRARAQWEAARGEAPELAELGFWQAMTLADDLGEFDEAASLLRSVLSDEPRRSHWYDLIGRLEQCGLLERPGVGKEILDRLDA